ncbi:MULTISPECIES: gephyrin-like molybdotransferase Glp [Protofrankia]|uniref:Molybdopterin molybdenumtransferase n=1 Tax=Protofrankia coriariae TaxID=1562887 RepID=A0ABR5EZY5_9ACTN|nr:MULTISPECIES: gephyrin-like molybdotransferase Glp [Protofrankia]KLL09965.1 molybdopterin biosynthesis protein MoeA [Protofrankia coriariae]ONH32374.1 molybdopterin molybdenumtransferase MoeA [Protofrankia sp. BMG5.30]
MKSVDAHLADILAAVGPLPPRPLPLGSAHGCVLAADLHAATALPGFDNSAMDGYALHAADVAGAGPDHPVTLPVTGDIPAAPGTPAPVAPGTAVRIMTGAPLPPGADTVVQIEWTDGRMDQVTVARAPVPGQNIRRAGEDVAVGDLVLPAGRLLGAAQIGLLAALNVAAPTVHPRPRVAVLSTGSELVEVGGTLGPGQIVDSNSHAVAAAAREAGARVRRLAGVPDSPDAFAALLGDVRTDTDAVITTGGVSVGAFDVVKQVLAAAGTVRFERLAMRPGMPQGFGVLDGVPVFTLPGNPVSALVSFELFVRPALRRMRGLAFVHRPTLVVTTAQPVRAAAGRRSYLRVRLADGGEGRPPVAHLTGGQGAHQMSALAAADALLIVPADGGEVPAGRELTALLLDDEVTAAGRLGGALPADRRRVEVGG